MIASPLVLALFGFGGWKAATAQSEGAVRRLARDNGVALTAEELYPAYKGDPARNSADLVHELESLLRDLRGKKRLFEGAKPGPDYFAEIEKSLSDTPEAFSLAERIADAEDFYVERRGDLPAVTFPEFATVKAAAKHLAFRSELRAHKGDLVGCQRDLDRIEKLARFMGKEPLLIGGLVQLAIQSIGMASAARSLPALVADKDATRLVETWVDGLAPMDFSRAFEGEATMSAWVGTRPLALGSIAGNSESEAQASYRAAELTRFAWNRKLIEAWLKVRTEVRANPTDPDIAEAAMNKHMKPLTTTRDPLLVVAEVLLPAVSQLPQAARRGAAKRAVLKAGIDALRTGRANVEWTRDPLATGPLKSRKTDTGWLIYSVGADGVDDGGVFGEKSKVRDTVLEFDGEKARLRG